MSEKITSYDLATTAVSLSGAIAGLASFADDRINSVEVKREDISALHGLLDAVVLFANHHESIATKYFYDGLFNDEAEDLERNLSSEE